MSRETRETLESLLGNVTDEELDNLRDAILREEGRRRSQYRLNLKAPYPPLSPDDTKDGSPVARWAKLLAWDAKAENVPPAKGKRGVSIRLQYISERPDGKQAGILLQEALVEAGLLLGRTPEWMDATTTEVNLADQDAVQIELWDKPGEGLWL